MGGGGVKVVVVAPISDGADIVFPGGEPVESVGALLDAPKSTAGAEAEFHHKRATAATMIIITATNHPVLVIIDTFKLLGTHYTQFALFLSCLYDRLHKLGAMTNIGIDGNISCAQLALVGRPLIEIERDK